MKPNFPCSGSDRYSTETDTARWPLAGSPSVESCRTPRHRGRRGGGDRRRLSRGETQNRSVPVAVVVVVETHQAEIVCSCVGKISHRLPERLRLRVRDPHRTTREVTRNRISRVQGRIGTPLKLILSVGPSRVHRPLRVAALPRSEEHTSESSHLVISYA